MKACSDSWHIMKTTTTVGNKKINTARVIHTFTKCTLIIVLTALKSACILMNCINCIIIVYKNFRTKIICQQKPILCLTIFV